MPTAAACTFGRKVPMSPRLLPLLLLSALCACDDGPRVPGVPQAAGDERAPAGEPVAGFPREVALWDGSSLRLEEPPHRIVPANATAVDLVAALVGPERVAGFPVQALDYSTLHAGGGAFAELPRFDAWLAEPVLALEPDLVVVDPYQAIDTNARLREASVRVLVLPEIATYPDAREALERLSRVLGAEERCAAIVADLDARVARLREEAGRRSREPLRAMCYSNFGSAGWTAGSGTTVNAMMELAGLVNVVAEAGRVGHVGASFEDLLTFDPDLILVSRPLAMEAGHAGDRGGASERVLSSEPSLAGLRAVREHRIVSLPAWLYAAGSHEMVTGAEVLAAEVDALQARIGEEQR
jgi:iron complex transport system substrate-binding protein